jgi:hypothetical protein
MWDESKRMKDFNTNCIKCGMKETRTKTKATLQVSNKLIGGPSTHGGVGVGCLIYSVVEPYTIKL